MEVIFTEHDQGRYFTARPTDDDERRAIVQDMQANGSPIGDGDDPFFCQTAEELTDALDSLGVVSVFPVTDWFRYGELTVDVDAWTFRRLCGYAAG